MPAARRARIIGLAAAGAHLVLAWLLPALLAFFLLCAAATLVASGVLARTLHAAERDGRDDGPPRGGDGGGDGGGGDGGGGGGPREPVRPDPGPEGEPAWWPDFEAAFRAHASRERSPV